MGIACLAPVHGVQISMSSLLNIGLQRAGPHNVAPVNIGLSSCRDDGIQSESAVKVARPGKKTLSIPVARAFVGRFSQFEVVSSSSLSRELPRQSKESSPRPNSDV